MGAIVKAGKIFQVVLVVFALILIAYCVDGINFAAWGPFAKPIGLIALTGGFLPVVLFQGFCEWIFP